MADAQQQEHIVMLPFMAHGHLIPFLALATQIHQTTGFTITIATTPLNIHYLRRSSTTANHRQIRLVALPFNSSDHGLPPNTENTEAVPLSQLITLLYASTTLEAPCHQLLADITAKDGRPPICIISDVVHGWATRVAQKVQTVNVSFTTCGAYGTATYVSLWQNLPHRRSPETDEYFSVPGFPNSCRFHRSQIHQFLRAADGNDSWSRYFRPQIVLSLESSFGWLCNTAEEIEPLGLEALRKVTKLPVWTIGPLLPPTMLKLNHSSSSSSSSSSSNLKSLILGQHSGKECEISPKKCLEWLDLHPQGSVLYISFGSQNTISASQMMELAKGLEDSGKPFIWVVRPPIGFDLKGEFKAEWLPDGFEERMVERKQGMLVRSWAPQLEILCHKSTGAFLSHCGWNSVMESLSQGVPIIGWPLAAEQAYNAKMMVEEMGVCVEITRRGIETSVGREEVKSVIDLVMEENGKKGKEMKKNAVKIGELIKAALREDEKGHKGSSLQAIDDFISAIVSAAESRRQ
ncbi:UDP-glycosyltransferase 92A1-like [Camellia sinensis]|uniref:Glycosyltransferase n=1 Tax=Camellia sinensis var. sinensis TaxID=542762 RepID=A0A4S4E6Q8_CAMSN|nr:UDP-glycosyltransferase 92A1-like [Camellia sinensis]THG11254.1 hypothetical protein TEA_000079 [Camellia sinensis var. sinensis]